MTGPASGSASEEYILGASAAEIRRLHFQHLAWLTEARALWERAGVRAGSAILDLGCGPGFTALALAPLVGAEGQVVARDQSQPFLQFLEAEAARLCLPQVQPSKGPVEELELPAGTLDAVYARWLLCWLPAPGAALQRLVPALRPGGVVLVHDYLDWGAMRLLPESAAFARGVQACLASFAAAGGDINVGRRIPALAAAAGLALERFQPLSYLAPAGSPKWRWVGEFLDSYLPRTVELGLLDAATLAAFRRDWSERASRSGSYLYTPTMVEAILRKSAGAGATP